MPSSRVPPSRHRTSPINQRRECHGAPSPQSAARATAWAAGKGHSHEPADAQTAIDTATGYAYAGTGNPYFSTDTAAVLRANAAVANAEGVITNLPPNLRAAQLMHAGDQAPIVPLTMPMREVLDHGQIGQRGPHGIGPGADRLPAVIGNQSGWETPGRV